jgi:division protein CdvB (Snf7/Vps24/ESCRT-III family)
LPHIFKRIYQGRSLKKQVFPLHSVQRQHEVLLNELAIYHTRAGLIHETEFYRRMSHITQLAAITIPTNMHQQ